MPLLIVERPSAANEGTMHMYPYSASLDYSLAGSTTLANGDFMKNDVYAQVFHPSEQKVGSMGIDDGSLGLHDFGLAESNDHKQSRYVYADQAYTIRSYRDAIGETHADPPATYTPPAVPYTPIAFVPNAGHIAYESALAGNGHHFGHSTCEWLRDCVTTGVNREYPGSLCQVQRDATTISGYCFDASNGMLECGRMIDASSADGTNSVRMTANGMVARCARGSAAFTLGTYTNQVRLKVGGCMINSDLNYTSTAEVHVPQMCYEPANFNAGCMFPGATNYDPSATQPAPCHYATYGCTSPTALNYNSEASLDDNSCEAAVTGCTVRSSANSYDGVSSGTPGFQERYVGMQLRSVGHQIFAGYPSVTNYNSNANVNQGCIVAVEGCMDPTALNYNANANINSNTWCIPVVRGCMMPPQEAASLSLRGTASPRSHERDGLALNFNPAATQHVQSMCVIYRRGCMEQTITYVTTPTPRTAPAVNYDPRATVAAPCWPTLYGCLDDAAVNFNCTAFVNNDGTRITAPCSGAGYIFRPVAHDAQICLGEGATLIESGVQPLADGASVQNMLTTIVAAGSVSDYGASRLASMATDFDAVLGTSGSTFVATAGSVNLVATTPMTSSAQYASASAAVSSNLNSLDAINSALGVQALQLPRVEPGGASGGNDDGAIIGGAVGGSIGGLLLIGGVAVIMKRKGKKIEA